MYRLPASPAALHQAWMVIISFQRQSFRGFLGTVISVRECCYLQVSVHQISVNTPAAKRLINKLRRQHEYSALLPG